MEAKHTPGPWFVDATRQKGLAIRADSKMVCQIPGYGVGTRVDDARLIAAAPELLKTLRHVEGALLDITCERTSILKGVRAAIAKATGEAV